MTMTTAPRQRNGGARTAIGQLKIDNLVAHFAGRPLFPPV
jgi:hypothetical protein